MDSTDGGDNYFKSRYRKRLKLSVQRSLSCRMALRSNVLTVLMEMPRQSATSLILFFFVEYGFYNFTGLGRHVFDVLSDLCEYLFIEFGVFLIFNCNIMQFCTAAEDVFLFPEIDAGVFDSPQQPRSGFIDRNSQIGFGLPRNYKTPPAQCLLYRSLNLQKLKHTVTSVVSICYITDQITLYPYHCGGKNFAIFTIIFISPRSHSYTGFVLPKEDSFSKS